MKTIKLALAFSMFASSAAALELTAPVNTCSVIHELSADLKRLGGIDANMPCFDIRFSLPPETKAIQYQVGAYFPENDTIALARDVDLSTVFGKSVLLHEMVHMAQHQRDDIPNCVGRLESEAYFIQGIYLSEHGLKKDAMMTHLLGGLMGQCADSGY